MRKDINKWGIFTRLCHERALLKEMPRWLKAYGLDCAQEHRDRAEEQLRLLIERLRKGRCFYPKKLRIRYRTHKENDLKKYGERRGWKGGGHQNARTREARQRKGKQGKLFGGLCIL